MIERKLLPVIEGKLETGKVIIVLGARQTGKTTLLNELKSRLNDRKTLFLNCDEPDIRAMLSDRTSTELASLIADNEIIFIDEAQRVKNIGMTLKILKDNFKYLKIAATGSSSLELSDKINEPLTGRKYEYTLFPFSYSELYNKNGMLETKRKLEQYLIYGMYPDVINNPDNSKEILLNLTGSYLYKDIFFLYQIRKPELIEKLLRAVALQCGSKVSYNELASLLQTSKETVATYLNLLEKAFVIFRLGAFSRNLRNELSRTQKYYFWDNGIRNALLGNFSPLEMRADTGILWENFIISERLKKNSYSDSYYSSYFWRTVQKQEIDYIEESDGKLSAYEIKWNPKKKVKFTKTFTNAYQNAATKLIHRDNFTEFIL
jgi:uncharacterized protein